MGQSLLPVHARQCAEAMMLQLWALIWRICNFALARIEQRTVGTDPCALKSLAGVAYGKEACMRRRSGSGIGLGAGT